MSKFKLTQTAAEVQGILNNSLQKPTGLTKTKLVGVGVNGQENIEIGDNLTLANGKLSAATGSLPSTIKFDEEGNRTVGKNLKVDGDIYSSALKTNYDQTGKLPVIYGWSVPSVKAIGACYHDKDKITSPAFIDYFDPNWDITLNGCYSDGNYKNRGFRVKVACAFAFCNFVLRNSAQKIVVASTFMTNRQIDDFGSGTNISKLIAAFKKELSTRSFGWKYIPASGSVGSNPTSYIYWDNNTQSPKLRYMTADGEADIEITTDFTCSYESGTINYFKRDP